MKRSYFALIGAVATVAGCSAIPPLGGKAAPEVEAEQIIQKSQQYDGGCGLGVRTVNHLARNFIGINASVTLLDKDKNSVGMVQFYDQTTIRGGSTSLHQAVVGASCDAIAEVKLNYLSFQTPYGYYDPIAPKAHIGKDCPKLLRLGNFC